ncbi:hypothetical protein GLOIN_2v1869416 [Rhizophagus clarus]|uniref:Uncharacterized protein n=1 Tax=Rhizophagus clarus TaxID=94130 RepID=A0A8H3M577_9GLOM|nr:hypothetical protein GLOIN_2v1869416 [Rhizophagus clarus]
MSSINCKKVNILKYFIQRLLIHFESCNSNPIQIETERCNVGTLDADRIRAFQRKIKSIRAPIFALSYLLDKKHKQLVNTNEDLYSKENNMELFHFLPAVFHVINHARIQKKNLKYIKDLILSDHENGKLSSIKSTDFLVQESFLRPITILMFRIRPLRNNNRRRCDQIEGRNINQRRRHGQNGRRRNWRQSNVSINNEDTLDRISNLSRQITNNPLIDQFFNGSSFI